MVYNGTATVVVTGNKVPLLPVSTKADWVTVYPRSANAGPVYTGGSTVSAAGDSGAPLNAGDAFVYWPLGTGARGIYDLNLIFVDGTAADGVTFVYGRG